MRVCGWAARVALRSAEDGEALAPARREGPGAAGTLCWPPPLPALQQQPAEPDVQGCTCRDHPPRLTLLQGTTVSWSSASDCNTRGTSLRRRQWGMRH